MLLDKGDLLPSPSSASVVAAPGAPPPAAPADPALNPADQALEAKLQPFIKCMNGVDRELEQFHGKHINEIHDIRQTLAGKPPSFPSNIPALRFTLNGFMSNTDIAQCSRGCRRPTPAAMAAFLDGPAQQTDPRTGRIGCAVSHRYAAAGLRRLPVRRLATAAYRSVNVEDGGNSGHKGLLFPPRR